MIHVQNFSWITLFVSLALVALFAVASAQDTDIEASQNQGLEIS